MCVTGKIELFLGRIWICGVEALLTKAGLADLWG